MIDVTRAILVRVRKQEDDDNEGCFNTKPKPFKSALDVCLQLNFLVESESCSSSVVQPLLHYCIYVCPPLPLLFFLSSPHFLPLPHFTFTRYLTGTLVTEKD